MILFLKRQAGVVPYSPAAEPCSRGGGGPCIPRAPPHRPRPPRCPSFPRSPAPWPWAWPWLFLTQQGGQCLPVWQVFAQILPGKTLLPAPAPPTPSRQACPLLPPCPHLVLLCGTDHLLADPVRSPLPPQGRRASWCPDGVVSCAVPGTGRDRASLLTAKLFPTTRKTRERCVTR